MPLLTRLPEPLSAWDGPSSDGLPYIAVFNAQRSAFVAWDGAAATAYVSIGGDGEDFLYTIEMTAAIGLPVTMALAQFESVAIAALAELD